MRVAAPTSGTRVSRLLILVPSVPCRLDDRVPWHFFQELRPIAASGVEVCVAASNAPDFEIPGVRFVALGRESLRGSLFRLLGTLAGVARQHRSLPRGGSVAGLKKQARLYQWNRAVSQVVREFKPDVIHSHWAYPMGSAGYLAAEETGVPLVMTLRGYEHVVSPEFGYGDCLDPFYERTLIESLKRAAKITVCCSDSVRRLAELGFRDDPRVVTLYHAINADRFRGTESEAADWKQKLRLEGRRVVTCIAGMIHGRKGHATLIEAFARIANAYPDATLLLVGDGPLRGQLEGLASELGMSSRIVFHGAAHPNDVQHLIRLSEFTVLPTHCEVFGNVVFESLVVGTPVISGSVGAAKDVLPLGPYGRLFPPGDVDALSGAIVDVLDHPELARREAALGREYVLSHMSLRHRVDGFLSLYRELAPSASIP